jgi:hypothetical protein
LNLKERKIIPNDAKLFAQADSEKAVTYYLTSDTESAKIYNLLKQKIPLSFMFLDINTPCSEAFGFLDL